jgi:hypothetical protein
MKTSELTGAALDWAVTRANYEINHETVWEQDRDTCEYSTDWAQAGPIIEREKIEIRESKGRWIAMWWADNSGMVKNPAKRFEFNRMTKGETPLIAAMRCYVASRLGDDVTVPDGLV